MRWLWLPMLAALPALAACGGTSPTTAEELPREYWQAMVNEDWSRVWDLFSAEAKEVCTLDYFLQSREWFKEQSGDSYDFWLSTFRDFSEADWEVRVSGDTATIRLPGQGADMQAVLEEDGWRVARSGEYNDCLPFRP